MPQPPSFPRRALVWISSAVLAASAIGLSACAPSGGPTPTDRASNGASAQPSPAATKAALVKDGTAQDNLPIFTATAEKVWATDDKFRGRAYIDALVEAGFTKKNMQVTSDATTIDNPAESISFSVRWGDECLIGQVGEAVGGPRITILPGLADGKCLVGKTRAIDW